MTQLRCTLGALLGLMLAACGDNATIVSVNISYADEIEAPAKIHLKLSQGSQTPVDDTFDAPTNKAVVDNMTTDVADRAYFKRYDLSGWADGEATLKVDLLNTGGTVYETIESKFEVEEGVVVAAYAEFKAPPADETSGDTGSDSSEASTAPSSEATGEESSTAGESTEGTDESAESTEATE